MKNKRFTYQPYILFLTGCFCCFLLLFTSCANPVAPTGGQKDKTAPGIDSTKSTPSPSTNFKDDRISLTFDEWVKLDNVNSQLVISPPLEETPEVKLKGKTVELIFKDSLRENTTYTVYFGDAVKDITEGNSAKNLNVTFSTGPYLDSLETKGSVIDAYTGEKKENMLVMLYEANSPDSVVYKKKPLYLAKTESNGSFNIKHIKQGEYKVFALEDKNLNYLFDASETIGFLKENIVISDSVKSNIKLLVFTEEQDLTVQGVMNRTYGKTTLSFNRLPDDVQLEVLQAPSQLNHYTEVVKDSIWFWYENMEEAFEVLVKEEATVLDTIEIKPASQTDFLERENTGFDFDRTVSWGAKGTPKGKKQLGKAGAAQSSIPETKLFEKARLKALKKKFLSNKTEYLYFTFPLKALDASKIIVVEDSSGQAVQPDIQLSDSLKRALTIRHNWKSNVGYTMLFEPGAITSFHDFENDSLMLEVSGVSTDDFGSISLLVEGLSVEKAYLLTLLDRLEQVIFETEIKGVETYEKMLEEIQPASGYKVRLVEDSNLNGKWDAGNYLSKKEPERVLIQPLQTVKPNWEVEGKINFNPPIQEKPKGFK